MKLHVKIFEDCDRWGDVFSQDVVCAEVLDVKYSVCDLCDCPEAAIIYRDLVSAYDYIDILKLGMRLAFDGYTDIEIETENKS